MTATSRPPLPWLLAWSLLAAAAAAALWELAPVWAQKAELTDRFLVPLTSIYLVVRLWPRLLRTPSQPTLAGLPLLALGALLFPAGWFVVVQVGGRAVVLWSLTLTLIAATLGLSLAYAGWRRTRPVVFPTLFVLFALPMPDRIYVPLQVNLKEAVTRVAQATFGALSIPCSRNGYLLDLPSGVLGVAEACSGVRSLSGLIAIAVLVVHLKRLRWWRAGAVLIASSLAIIASNAVRIVVTGLLQELVGPWAVEGWAHEALGVLVILVGLGLVVLLANLLGGKPVPEEELPADPVPLPPARGGWLALAILLAALSATLAAETRRKSVAGMIDLEAIPQELNGWTGENLPVLPSVAELLASDRLVHRRYRDPLGREVEVWLIYWAAASTAHTHNPDICMPSAGWASTGTGKLVLPRPGDRPPLSAVVRHFRKGPARRVILFWTQTGANVESDEGPAADDYSGHGYLLTLLNGAGGLKQTSGLTVHLSMAENSSPEVDEATFAQFCKGFLPALYKVCPEALAPE